MSAIQKSRFKKDQKDRYHNEWKSNTQERIRKFNYNYNNEQPVSRGDEYWKKKVEALEKKINKMSPKELEKFYSNKSMGKTKKRTKKRYKKRKHKKRKSTIKK